MACWLAAIIGCLIFAGHATAQPQQEGPSFGWEETIVPIAELDPDQRAMLKMETGFDLSLGFAYRRAYVFSPGFSFWHWKGRYVLYFGGNLFEPTEQQLTALLGKDRFASLPVPTAYRIPAGLVITLLIIAAISAGIYFFPVDSVKTQRLLSDPKYVRALEIYHASLPADEEPTKDEIEAAIVTAGEYLTQNQALDKAKVETQLRFMLAEINRARTQDLRQLAAAHEQCGNWEEALDLYEQAADLREPWDAKDHAFLLKCVARVERKVS
ncbi:tetratricopeptide repeat protein [Anatilimnocola sp. NA78]|uniref:tetratricopeptide repeat protein n=1 Tax=Anatilimnocola sp. NA78 TaxID=3415683 RepID=UPI003CE5194E